METCLVLALFIFFHKIHVVVGDIM